jgi:predicted mannosyl-3-phosphoglycerate phosphatase (HAD superfamily)
MPRLQVVVSEEQKERWNGFAEDEPGMDSVSDLIRTSVERHMSTEDSEGDELNTEVVDEIVTSLDKLERQVSDVKKEVKTVGYDNVEEDEIEEIVHLALDERLDMLEEYVPELFENARQAAEADHR